MAAANFDPSVYTRHAAPYAPPGAAVPPAHFVSPPFWDQSRITAGKTPWLPT